MNFRGLRLAYFARGIDGLYLPEGAGWRAYALVRADTPEADWAQQFLPRERCLPYRLRELARDPYPATDEVLHGSNIHRVLKRHDIRSLVLSSPFSPAVRAWTRQHGIRVLGADYDDQRRLENKLWFDRFLEHESIPRPEAVEVTVGRPPPVAPRGRVVVQRADSLGGEGTFFLRSLAELPDLATKAGLPGGERCLARRYIPGRSYGITVFVAPGVVALSAIRLQCTYPARKGNARKLFAGVQWVPSRQLAARLRRRIEAVFLDLGDRLYRRLFFGFANFDFLVDRHDGVWVIECNPRMSAATPQLLADRRLMGDVPVDQLFLEGCVRPRRFPRRRIDFGLPSSDFAGSTLDIMAPVDRGGRPPTVRRQFPSGLYSLQGAEIAWLGPDVRRRAGDERFCLFSFAALGQECGEETTLATILSNVRLYDCGGRLNAQGRRLAEFFRYT